MTATDEIRLTLPAERDFFRVAHLVLGGLAVRLNLTFESLEDLQLALDGLLDRDPGNGELTVCVSVGDGVLETLVGPFGDHEQLREELERVPGDDMTLRRVLDAVVDDVTLENRDGEHWVRLTKRVERLGAK
jgi:anti-sigma regulatory factor (Ser/Thr protein kinase)